MDGHFVVKGCCMVYISLQKKKNKSRLTRSALIFAVGDDQSPLQVVHLKGVYPYIWLLSHQRISTSKTSAQVKRKKSMYYCICLFSHHLDTSQMSHCFSFHIFSFTHKTTNIHCKAAMCEISCKNKSGWSVNSGIIISLWVWICLHLKQSCKCACHISDTDNNCQAFRAVIYL